jgi:hypothetical protein
MVGLPSHPDKSEVKKIQEGLLVILQSPRPDLRISRLR